MGMTYVSGNFSMWFSTNDFVNLIYDGTGRNIRLSVSDNLILSWFSTFSIFPSLHLNTNIGLTVVWNLL